MFLQLLFIVMDFRNYRFPKIFFWMMLYLIQEVYIGHNWTTCWHLGSKFDQLSIISNFVIQPLAFLSGTFYSIERLPESLKILAYCNPFFMLLMVKV